MKVYIAGKITGDRRYRAKFREAAKALEEAGHVVLNPATLPDGLDDVEATHINLNDQTLEGLRHKTLPIMSVQYHPEAAAGPHDGRYLFERFHEMMKAALA